MSKLFEQIKGIVNDEEGTALVEYSILLGVVAVACVAAAVGIGIFSSGQFTSLCTTLQGINAKVTC